MPENARDDTAFLTEATTAVILREMSEANELEESPGSNWLLFEEIG